MKTLIVYGTTYGFTKECVQQLAGKLEGEVAVVNAMTEAIPAVKGFDNVIVGGSIYMGQIQKKVKEFCTASAGELSKKRLGLFLCCGLPENLEQTFKNSFPEVLLKKAAARECFGGALRVEKMKLMHKVMTNMMVKAAEKEGKGLPKPAPDGITKLVEAINGNSIA